MFQVLRPRAIRLYVKICLIMKKIKLLSLCLLLGGIMTMSSCVQGDMFDDLMFVERFWSLIIDMKPLLI